LAQRFGHAISSTRREQEVHHDSEIVRDVLRSASNVGGPSTEGTLTLFPLFGGMSGPDYMVGVDAFEQGLLRVTELGQGSVPQLTAHNNAAVPVLLIDGEHLRGARQDRVLNSTVLLPAEHETVLPVSCVEHGRWGYRRDLDFTLSRDFAFAELRAVKKRAVLMSLRAGTGHASDQGEVWRTVAAHFKRLSIDPSATGAMADSFESMRARLDELQEAFAAPSDRQTGVVACVSGRPVAMDLFDKPQTLAKLWSRLISGYASSALAQRAEVAVSPDDVQRFVRDLADGDASMHDGVGLGMNVALTGDSGVGDGLVWEGVAIHVAAFGRPIEQRPERGADRSYADS